MITEKKPFSDNNKEMLFSSSSKGRFSVKRAISLFLFFEKIFSVKKGGFEMIKSYFLLLSCEKSRISLW